MAEERQISNFECWHDQLIILKQVFGEAEPDTINRGLRDQGKWVQWYTFWGSALVLALTIVSGFI